MAYGTEERNKFAIELDIVLDNIRVMLMSKQDKYGDSALNPKRIFSKANPIEQINVRIDDKLSRVMSGHCTEDEDPEWDLMGYFVLKRIAVGRLKAKTSKHPDDDLIATVMTSQEMPVITITPPQLDQLDANTKVFSIDTVSAGSIVISKVLVPLNIAIADASTNLDKWIVSKAFMSDVNNAVSVVRHVSETLRTIGHELTFINSTNKPGVFRVPETTKDNIRKSVKLIQDKSYFSDEVLTAICNTLISNLDQYTGEEKHE